MCKKRNKTLLFLGKHKLEINTSPDPSDIIWENLEVSTKEFYFRRIIVMLIILFILLAGFVVIYIIRKYEISLENPDYCQAVYQK